jgi:hypothetical protein
MSSTRFRRRADRGGGGRYAGLRPELEQRVRGRALPVPWRRTMLELGTPEPLSMTLGPTDGCRRPTGGRWRAIPGGGVVEAQVYDAAFFIAFEATLPSAIAGTEALHARAGTRRSRCGLCRAGGGNCLHRRRYRGGGQLSARGRAISPTSWCLHARPDRPGRVGGHLARSGWLLVDGRGPGDPGLGGGGSTRGAGRHGPGAGRAEDRRRGGGVPLVGCLLSSTGSSTRRGPGMASF